MKMNRVIRALRNHWENGFSFYFICFFSLILGIIMGAIVFNALSDNSRLSILRLSSPYFFLSLKENFLRSDMFKISFYFNFFFIMLVYICGLVNMGLIVPIFIFIKGGFLGFNVGYLITNFGIKGFFAALLGIYPQYLIYIPCYIIICSLAITVSRKQRISARRAAAKVRRIDIGEYSLLFAVVTVFILVGILYEGFVSPIFLNIIG